MVGFIVEITTTMIEIMMMRITMTETGIMTKNMIEIIGKMITDAEVMIMVVGATKGEDVMVVVTNTFIQSLNFFIHRFYV